MPRQRRFIVKGMVYHLIARFVAHEWFVRSDDERRRYLNLLGRGLARCDWKCLAFAVMSNHIHLALEAGSMSLGSWLRDVHGEFAEWVNLQHERIGAVFVQKPKCIPFQRYGVATLLAYIHRNPVRAGVVHRARDSDWTSHPAYLSPSIAPSWLHVDRGLELAGFVDRTGFDTWVDAWPVERADLSRFVLKPISRPSPFGPASAPLSLGLAR